MWALKGLMSTVSEKILEGPFKVFFDAKGFKWPKKNPPLISTESYISSQEMIATSSSACCCERSSNPSIGALATQNGNGLSQKIKGCSCFILFLVDGVERFFCCYICGLHFWALSIFFYKEKEEKGCFKCWCLQEEDMACPQLINFQVGHQRIMLLDCLMVLTMSFPF